MPVELREALQQINEIRGQLATTETFRGYRAVSAAATGLMAVLTAVLQGWLIRDAAADPLRYVVLWTGTAVLCLAGSGLQVLYVYLLQQSAHRRATTRIATGQLLPALAAGAVVTFTLGQRGLAEVCLLPGLWAVLFGMGVFASRRHLPRAIGWVALFYLLSGAAVLAFLPGPAALSPWLMGSVFGIGQSAAALVLYWNLERNGQRS
jgi:hypothetical protein